jgi:hypothetical protein
MTETAAPSRAILPDELYPAHGQTLTLKPWQGPFRAESLASIVRILIEFGLNFARIRILF